MNVIGHSKNRIYAAILILGAVALAVDRFIMPEGVSTPAVAVAADQPPRTGEVKSAPKGPSPMQVPELPFPRGLEAFDGQGAIRDLFAPPTYSDADTAESATDKDGSKSGKDADRGRAQSANLVTQHDLDGVLIHERLRIAVVDGVWLRIGDSIDGCTLAAVAGRTAQFTCSDGEAVLEVADQLSRSAAKVRSGSQR